MKLASQSEIFPLWLTNSRRHGTEISHTDSLPGWGASLRVLGECAHHLKTTLLIPFLQNRADFRPEMRSVFQPIENQTNQSEFAALCKGVRYEAIDHT